MKIKVYKKEHVAGIVLLQDDKIIGMIHLKFNKDFNSFEVKRVATTVTGLGEELYFLLSISLNGIFIIKDTVCSMPKAEYLWKKFVNSQVWDKVVFNNNILFRVKPTNFHKIYRLLYPNANHSQQYLLVLLSLLVHSYQ